MSNADANDRIQVSVVIAVAAGDYEWVPLQLERLRRQRTTRSFEIVVGDNGGALADVGSDVRVVRASAQRGPAFARDAAVHAATGCFVLFCDADDLVGEAWIEGHARALEHASYTTGSTLKVDASDVRYADALAGRWPTGGFTSTPFRHEGVAFATTANCGIHRELYTRLGGFPVAYQRMEDVALGLAARLHGVDVVFVPDAEVLKVNHALPASVWRRVHFETGRSIVRLSRAYHVGPGATTITLRALARVCRAIAQVVLREPLPRNRGVRAEVEQLSGAVAELLNRGAAGRRASR